MIEPSGRFSPGAVHPNLRIGPQGAKEFVLAHSHETYGGRDVVLTQNDVRALQLAKGAIKTGIDMLCRSARCGRLQEIILAGSFGRHLDAEDLLTIGLLPPISPAKVRVVGNAAGMGAIMAVLSACFTEEVKAFAQKVQVVELALQKDFQDVFLNSLSFPDPSDL
jgi:uncharacterized 2Fe-2S/4Fe-4S cluster protein (DUF4445 family)